MKVQNVPLDRIEVLGDNVREEIGDVTELAESIEQQGLLQPLVVSQTPGGTRFHLIAGHRRLSACTQLGMKEVPVVVRKVKDATERLEIMLAENVHRRSLTPLEEGRAYKRLIDKGLTRQYIARRMKLSGTTVGNCLFVLELPKNVQRQIHRGEVPLHATLNKYRREYKPRPLPTAPHGKGVEGKKSKAGIDGATQGGGAPKMPEEFREQLHLLADVCDRTKYSFERAKALAERLVAGVTPREAIGIVVRLVENRERGAA